LVLATGCANRDSGAQSRAIAVQHYSFAWRDEQRLDPLSADTTAKREYLVYAWIPAANTPSSALLPLLLFSPGAGVSPTSYDSLLTAVARGGYAILAVAHTYTTDEVAFPDGHVVRSSESRVPFNFATHVPIVATDLVAALDYVTRARERGDARFTRLDVSRVAAFGHSYGGSAALEACLLDARFKAAMDLDGSVFGTAVLQGAACPFFLLKSSPQPQDPRDHPQFYPERDQGYLHEHMTFDRSVRAYWLEVSRLDHMSFTDAAYSPSGSQRVATRVGMELDAPRVREVSVRYIRAFFGLHLLGAPAPPELRKSPYSFATLRFKGGG
jgi:pimeloyl-ACP methyl ester carboxylesterase